MIGMPPPPDASRPSMSSVTGAASVKPPLSTMPAMDGKVSLACAVSTASSTSLRSPGITTRHPSVSRGSTLSTDIAAITTPVTSRPSRDSSPSSSVPSTAAFTSSTVGATSSGSSGMAHAGTPVCSCSEPAISSMRVRVGAVRDHGEQARVGVHEFGQAQVGDLAQLVDGARTRFVHAPAGEHEDDGRAEVGRDPRVESEFGGGRDIRVVGADDDHGVALALDLLEPVDDA